MRTRKRSAEPRPLDRAAPSWPPWLRHPGHRKRAEGLPGKLKRPDYLVGLPFVGNMAFDVKSKTTYDGCLLFDVDEVEKLTAFDDLFRISTFFACLDPGGSDRAVWFRLPEPKYCRTRRMKSGAVYVALLSAGITVDMREPLLEALRATISLAL